MADGISLIIVKGTQGYDVTQLVEQIVWRGRKGSSSRTLKVQLVDDDGYKHARSEIDVEAGHQCIFSYNGSELFRGIIMSQTQTQKKILTFTAYDNGIYLANNKDTFTYENKTATDVFKDCCTRFGLPMGEVAQCTYKIPELTKSKTTAFDAIADALSLDFDATGIRHYVSSDKGKLSLLTRRENILQWVIEVGQNLSTYSYTRSIEDIKTRVKLISKEGTTLAEKSNSALESKIGVFQEIDKPDESLTTAQINDLITSMLDEKSTPERTLSVDAIGITDVISGIGVYIIIPELNLERTFYVDEDTHTFEDNKHTMSLKLNYANDLSKETKTAEESTASKDYAVGDIVDFNGGSHYVSSTASSPTGGTRKSGKAKLTLIAKGAKHPYHLIGGAYNDVSGDCNVYGWVDAGTFS
uniref:Tail protein n=1 Tax=Dulem virus 37 TaxID=3145755 RepID=A0AAU8AXJ7_9CAUD